MATAHKLVEPPRRQDKGSPLTPELWDFIDRAIVPALVKKYLREKKSEIALEAGDGRAHNPGQMGETK
jgi:hypothetical protein